MKIKVTEEHISRGEKGSRTSCPACLAVCGLYKPNINSEGTHLIYSPFPGRIISKRLPKKIQRFLEKFHSGEEVDPIEFTISYL